MDELKSDSNSEDVTLLIQQRVKKDSITRYEKWLPEMMAKAARHEGHQGVQVIRPPSGGNTYSIIIRYSSFAAAENWSKSEERKRLIEEKSDAFEVPDHALIHPGIEFWFTPTLGQKRPTGWKQWMVTTSVIWPLSMVIPRLYRPLFVRVPLLGLTGLREGIVASTIVALVVFWIMPRYVRAVSGWLYR